jgi:threonylcarbamoyladenosine tRNA methylthiotransferase MtaB
MSLQSGCTATLQRMRRPYTAAMYAAVVERIREAIPGVAITTDVIVGFPGETPAEFEESLHFVERMQFAKVHVFPYSPRPGTEAATLPDQVPYPEKKARVNAMLAVAEESERRFWEQHLGQQLTVLWETRKNGVWQGMTDNYIRVFGEAEQDLTNVFTATTLIGMTNGGMIGRVQETRDTQHLTPQYLAH